MHIQRSTDLFLKNTKRAPYRLHEGKIHPFCNMSCIYLFVSASSSRYIPKLCCMGGGTVSSTRLILWMTCVDEIALGNLNILVYSLIYSWYYSRAAAKGSFLPSKDNNRLILILFLLQINVSQPIYPCYINNLPVVFVEISEN